MTQNAPASSPRVRVNAGSSLSPDDEASLILERLASRVAVARSFARLCGGRLCEEVLKAAIQIRTSERARDLEKVARAAAAAARTVAASEVQRFGRHGDDDETPRRRERRPASTNTANADAANT